MWIKLVSNDGLSKFVDTGDRHFWPWFRTPLFDKSVQAEHPPLPEFKVMTRTYEYKHSLGDGTPVYEEVLM